MAQLAQLVLGQCRQVDLLLDPRTIMNMIKTPASQGFVHVEQI